MTTTMTPPDRAYDWADTFSGPQTVQTGNARAVLLQALGTPQLWLRGAMAVRNAVVSPFGLRREPQGQGHFLALLPLVSEREDRIELGLPDRHLDFTVTLLLRSSHVFFTTRIWFNNRLGRVYLRAVMPGHILAGRHCAARVANPVTRAMGVPEGDLT